MTAVAIRDRNRDSAISASARRIETSFGALTGDGVMSVQRVADQRHRPIGP
jgi:hypothetical protein